MITITDYYFTITQSGQTEYKDRGSKFLAFAYSVATVEEVKPIIDELKKEHPKASHYCFAYKIGLDGKQFRANDDGEPSGTAGKPIFGTIESKQLTNILIVVVRYFGGTLLGVPGLINAYKSAAALVLQTIPVIQKAVEVKLSLHFDYTIINDVMVIVKQYNCNIIRQDLQLFCHLQIGVPRNRLNEVMFKLSDIRGVAIDE